MPWDREQDHHSIRRNFIEETYEVCEAIDNDDPVLLQEELGDVLLQVAFHARMEEEAGRFDFGDVCDGICKKLIVRHPHVFGETKVADSGEVLVNWDRIKERTKGQKTATETLRSVSAALPALMRSEKVQHRAAKVGFDYPDTGGALRDLESEVAELREAISEGDAAHTTRNWGTCSSRRSTCPGSPMWTRSRASGRRAKSSSTGSSRWRRLRGSGAWT